jgi:hypothetical protein
MGQPQTYGTTPAPVGTHSPALARPDPANLADVLERVLDKGIVIAGDIRINLVDIELLTIRVRLLVASVDRAREMGIDWWEHDPMLSSRASADGERARISDEPESPDSSDSAESPDE